MHRFLFLAALLYFASSASSAFSQEPKRYYLGVSVEKYEHRALKPLQFCDEDITEMGDLLAEHGYEVKVLSEASAKKDPKLAPTKENIEREIEAIRTKATAADTVVFALAGHGLQFAGQTDAYFCPQEGLPFPDETKTLVSVGHIYRQFEKSKAGTRIILVDACRNDPDSTRGRGFDATTGPAVPQGVAALFSCSASQQALESEQLKHGVFFHYVLEALRSEGVRESDGEVTFDRMQAYVRKNVPPKVAGLTNHSRQQSPNLKADISGEPPILLPASIGKSMSKLEVLPFNFADKARTAEEARAAQEAWAKKLGVEVVETNSIGMKMVLIPPGEFMMGSSDEDIEKAIQEFPASSKWWKPAMVQEKPRHKVRISFPFRISAHEVTYSVFQKFATASKYKTDAERGDGKGGWGFNTEQKTDPRVQSKDFSWRNPGFAQAADHPVVNVSHYDARMFIEWINKVESTSAYRLPSEAQWEFACRAGTVTRYQNGEDSKLLVKIANIRDDSYTQQLRMPRGESLHAKDGYCFTAPVGSFAANSFGLYDMHGNVDEWTSDRMNSYEERNLEVDTDPDFSTSDVLGRERGYIKKGGGFCSEPLYSRISDRGYWSPDSRFVDTGFRIICSVQARDKK